MIRIQLQVEHLLCVGFFILDFFLLIILMIRIMTSILQKLYVRSKNIHMLIRIKIQAYLT